jgi:hypothetical protein
VAGSYGQTLCPHYVSVGSSFNTQAGCTNYAVGGGAINYFKAPTAPQSIVRQLKDAGAAGYGVGDLLLIDGGGNDAGDLISAYLAASKDGGQSYAALLGTVLDAATVNTLLAGGAAGLAQAGGVYMQALATQFAATIQAQALDKGAPRVAVLNMPGVTLTPKFRMVLASRRCSTAGCRPSTPSWPLSLPATSAWPWWISTHRSRTRPRTPRSIPIPM